MGKATGYRKLWALTRGCGGPHQVEAFSNFSMPVTMQGNCRWRRNLHFPRLGSLGLPIPNRVTGPRGQGATLRVTREEGSVTGSSDSRCPNQHGRATWSRVRSTRNNPLLRPVRAASTATSALRYKKGRAGQRTPPFCRRFPGLKGRILPPQTSERVWSRGPA